MNEFSPAPLGQLGIVGLQIFEQTDSVRYLMISVMMGSALFSLLCVVHVIVWPKYPTPQVLGGVCHSPRPHATALGRIHA